MCCFTDMTGIPSRILLDNSFIYGWFPRNTPSRYTPSWGNDGCTGGGWRSSLDRQTHLSPCTESLHPAPGHFHRIYWKDTIEENMIISPLTHPEAKTTNSECLHNLCKRQGSRFLAHDQLMGYLLSVSQECGVRRLNTCAEVMTEWMRCTCLVWIEKQELRWAWQQLSHLWSLLTGSSTD